MRKYFSIFAAALAAISLIATPAMADNTTLPTTADQVQVVRRDANSVGTKGTINVLKTYDAVGIGYGSSGCAVTQGTGRTTTVICSAYSGAITLISAAGSATPASFTVTNTAVAATDTIILNQKSGTDLLELHVTAVGAGSFRITFFTTGGTTTEQPVINFAVVRAKAS